VPQGPPLLFGVLRIVGAEAAADTARELRAYLEQALHRPVLTVLHDTPFQLGDALAASELDAAWLSPAGYIRAAARGPVRPLLRLQRDGFTTYRSVIFVRAGSGLQTVDDLAGRSMVWTVASSASGSLFPRAYLKRIGRDPDLLFGRQQDVADYRELCAAVLEGRADAGASMAKERPLAGPLQPDGCREAGFDPGLFAVIARTEPIPNDLVALRPGLTADAEAALRAALLAMPQTPRGREVLQNVFDADAFAEVADADFDPVREVKAYLEHL